jgi:asparagine synthase (glutamine-hydrolysing)
MPGIVGLVTRMPRARAEAELERMVQSLQHESFYVSGTWIDESLGVYVGWSVRKGSFSDRMPIRNERGDVVLIFAGEEYPEPGTVRNLADAALCPSALNGRFQGLVVDLKLQMATLFNDRYGMQRTYYHQSKDAFYFAAEAKAILAVRPELRKLDLRGLGEFTSCGCVLENRTLFEGIHLLPGAAAWIFRNGALQRKTFYFQPREWEDQPTLEPEAYYREIREVFSRNLPRYFQGDERIGTSLTGGLDTRMIMAWHRGRPGSLPCYSFGGMFRDCEDVRVARHVARVCGQSHQVIPAGNDFLSRFAHYAERSVYLTDASVDVSVCPDLYLHEKAREIAPVRMTGNYGGEVLRRVRAFKPIDPLPGLFRAELVPHIHEARNTYASLVQGHPLSFAAFQQSAWHHYGVLALEQTQLAMRTPYLDNEFVQTVFRAPQSACMDESLCLRMIADGNPALRQIRTDRGIGGDSRLLASAAARSWLALTFKAEYAYDYGMPPWLARIDHALSRLRLERMFLGRHKFYHFRVWYRDSLSGYVREMLLDQRTLSRPYLERKKVEAIVDSHVNGSGNYTSEIHKLLTLELLHRLFIDPQPQTKV